MYPRQCKMAPGSFRLIPGTMYAHRFRHLQKKHLESFSGLNAICLPDANPVGVLYRSSLPATPLSTPLYDGPQFSEEALRERLCKTPSPRKCRFFNPRHSDVGLNDFESKWQDLTLKRDHADRVTSPIHQKKLESYPRNKSKHKITDSSGYFSDGEEFNERSTWQESTKENQPTTLSLTKRVFVGNISYRVTKKELTDHFSQFGTVVQCVIVQDHIKKRPKGYGFITFSKPEEAVRAKNASLEQLRLDCRDLRVFPAEEKRTAKLYKEARKNLSQESSEEHEDSLPIKESFSKTVPVLCENINDLNDEILLTIFSYLEIKDRIRFEIVCKKWKILLSKVWHTQETLNFYNMFSVFRGSPLTTQILKSLLRRCGSGLKTLDLSNVVHELDFQVTEILGQLSPNLESINLTGIDLTSVSLQHMSQKCHNLKTVVLQRCLNIGEKGVWWLFNLCKSLEYVDLSGSKKITGQCFHIAGPHFRRVVLNACSQLSPAGVEKIAIKCPHLIALYLNDCSQITDQAVTTLCKNLPELQILHLGGVLIQLSASGLCHIGRLQNLEELFLSHNAVVNDDVIDAVCHGCEKLRYLDISGCNEGVTDLSLESLSTSPQLRTLYISYCGKITDSGLSALATQECLENVQARGCPQLGDTGFISLILLCPDLQCLDVSGCILVSNETVQAGLDAVKDKMLGSKLVITVGGTSVVPEKLNLDSPILEVSRLNLCADHLRPNHADWFGAVGGDGHQVPDEFVESCVNSDDNSLIYFDSTILKL